MENRLRLLFFSRPENVGLARLTVATLAASGGFSLPDLEEIKVAVSEAVTNAIVHGYQSAPDRWVTVEATLDDTALWVAVEDQGVGMADIAQAMTPRESADPERMGLGFTFMQTFMDQVVVTSEPGRGTRVEMRRRLAVADGLPRDAR